MPYYESVFIARQDISGAQVDSLTESFTNIIQEGGGQVTKKEFWGLRSLAYKIKKNRKGHYVLLNIDGPSDAVLEMERNMRINEDVIRYLTVRVEELESEESIVHHAPQPRQPRSRPWRPARRL
jgi:small subunit ribosomal protein S6